MPKHAIIAWLAILNRPPSMDKLMSWGIKVLGMFILCKQEQEPRDHLFFECSFSREIWRKVFSLSGIHKDVLDWNKELQWAVQKLKGKALILILMKVG